MFIQIDYIFTHVKRAQLNRREVDMILNSNVF